MADIKLLPYDEGMHDDMVRLIEQDNIFIAPWKGTEFYGKTIEDRIHGHLPRAQDPPGGPPGLTGYINC